MTAANPTIERFVARGHRFAAHTHDEFVISANGADVICERVRLDRRRLEVGPDEVTIYNPGEVQASTTVTRENSDWECFSIHVCPASVQVFTGRVGLEAVRPVVADARPAAKIGQFSALTDPQAAAEATLWAIGEVLDRVRSVHREKRSSALPSRVDLGPVLTRMRDDLSAPVSVPELAGAVGLSADQFLRAFVREIGIPPYAWHLHLRLLEGRRRLIAGETPTAVAAELGFADHAHFHRHFVAAYACTPGQVRARSGRV